MNRTEFMKRLRELLSDISESEREEALNYYEDYFDDAGIENEQEVIDSLGSPEKVARTIKEGLNDSNGEQGEFSEKGFQGYGDSVKDEVGYHGEESTSGRAKGFGTSGLVLLLVLAILVLPVLGPVCIGIVSAILGILAAAAALLFALIIAGFALVLLGIVLFGTAIPTLILEPAAGVLMFGCSFVLLGIGILLTIAGIWVVWKVLPPLVRWIVAVCRKPFAKKEA